MDAACCTFKLGRGYLPGPLRLLRTYLPGPLRFLRTYSPGPLRLLRTYLPGPLRLLRTYLPGPFWQKTTHWQESFGTGRLFPRVLSYIVHRKFKGSKEIYFKGYYQIHYQIH
jgi:hypothetical protein